MLTKSMKKSRKKRKMERIETDEDSYVSSVLLHAEKVKVKVRHSVSNLLTVNSTHEYFIEDRSQFERADFKFPL